MFVVCCLPPPKNSDCSNITSSQATTRDWKMWKEIHMERLWYGYKESLLALSIETSFSADHTGCWLPFLFVSLASFIFQSLRDEGRKKEAADRAVSLNVIWIEWETRRQSKTAYIALWISSLRRFSSDRNLADPTNVHNMLKHIQWVLLIQATCLNVRLCMHQKVIKTFLSTKSGEKKSSRANYMKCI